MKPYARWDIVEIDLNMNGVISRKHMFHSPGYDVYGIVSINLNGCYLWEARVLVQYRATCDKAPIRGISPTLEGAKKIVETLCYETGTCEREPEIIKDDLFEMILCYVKKLQEDISGNRRKIFDMFGDNGLKKLKDMIDARIILECSNGMLYVNEKYKNDDKR